MELEKERGPESIETIPDGGQFSESALFPNLADQNKGLWETMAPCYFDQVRPDVYRKSTHIRHQLKVISPWGIFENFWQNELREGAMGMQNKRPR